jgi:lysophospholipase L1-like esterase
VRMCPGLRRGGLALIVATTIALPPAPVGASGPEGECPVPESFSAFEPLLPRTAAALAGGSQVVVVALGGASSLGNAAGGVGLAWPARMGAALADRFPAARVKVVTLAVARQTAQEAAARLARDVLPLRPTLVIWETGTMEAVRGAAVDEFRDTLQAGIDELRAAAVEVVLMNAQFSRDTDAIIRFEPYLGAMRELADVNDVPLFHRHGIMRRWAETGALDLRASGGEKRRPLAAKLYDCIGRAMADFVTRDGARPEAATSPGGPR